MKSLVRACGLAVAGAVALVCFRAALIAYAVGQAASHTGIVNWQPWMNQEPLPELNVAAIALAVIGATGMIGAGLVAWRRAAPMGMKITLCLTAALAGAFLVMLIATRATSRHEPDIFDTLTFQPPVPATK